jgi:propanediol dehydratase small subunit
MSPVRIIIGLLVAGVFLAGELVAFWYFGFPEKWVPVALMFFVAGVGGLLMSMQTRAAMQPYWERACMGIRWRRRFPGAPKTEIREFLDLFVDAFAFRRKRRCSFSPEDRVMEVYRALYPPGSEMDSMELETLCKMLEKRYGVDFFASWREDITLREIYERTHRVA